MNICSNFATVGGHRSAVGGRMPALLPVSLLACFELLGTGPGCESIDENFDDTSDSGDDDDSYRLFGVGANVLATPGPQALWGNETSAVGLP